MSTTNAVILNSLLRGEISAIETYTQALAKFEGSPEENNLRKLRDEHTESANALRKHLHEEGGTPESGSGIWGAWAQFVQGTAKIFGKAAALKALKEGEEHGIKSYKSAVEDENVAIECKAPITTKLLPKCESHLSSLDGLISKV